MQLLKLFKFKGIFANGSKMNQPNGYFRRFINSFKDKTGRIKAFGIGAGVSNDIYNATIPTGSWKFPIAVVRFANGFYQTILGVDDFETGLGAVKFTREGINEAITMPPYRSNNTYPNTLDLQNHSVIQPSDSGNTAVVNRKAYTNFGVNLEKYVDSNSIVGKKFVEAFTLSFDGVRTRGLGLPTPWLVADPTGVLGAHYIRTVYATIGLDGEAIFSPFEEQQLSSAARDIYLGGYSTFPSAPLANSETRVPYDSLFEREIAEGFGPTGDFNFKYFDSRFLYYFGVGRGFSVAAGVITLTNPARSTSPDGTIDLVQVDDWLMIDIGAPVGDIPATTYMFQVATIGTDATFKTKFRYLDRNTLTWVDDNFATVWARWGAISAGIQAQFLALAEQFRAFTNIFQIISYSTTPTAGYRVAYILPVCWDSALTATAATLLGLSVPKTFSFPFLGVVTSFLSDWYDTTTAKALFPPMISITAYKELLVGCDRNAIYFSDTTLGGSTEMLNGNSNFVPLGSEYGELTAVCGSEEFLYVSRERRNYVIRGDLAIGNIQIFEADSSIEGSYNGNCVMNGLSGKVIFMNRTGIYSIDSTGTIVEISADIRDLFLQASEDGNLFDRSVFRTTAQLLDAFFDGSKFKIALDEERNFLLFSFARTSSFSLIDQSFTYLIPSNALIYDMNDGSWYEWDITGSTLVESIKSKTYCLGAQIKLEDGVMRGAEIQNIATSWMTADSPSLEKQITQVKWYGKVLPAVDTTRTLNVQQQNDWSTPLVTDVTYSTVDKYPHKQRLDASKAQSTSIIFKSTPTTTFEIEGIEVEGTVIQEGVKK